ncbi:MAG: hypothetical protein OIN90_19375 [Candidatus Methanoperedens sp.]|nr:hypothetical protein [Candidatus Methanoperedens sp.]
MKLIERLFGKKDNAGESIAQDKLPEWLELISRQISEKIEKETSSFYPLIEKTLRKIKNSTSELENAKPEGRFHLKMVKVASSNRDNMAKQVRMLLENITIPGEKDVKSIAAFHESTIQTLGVCLENMMKSYQYTKLVYFEESKNVITDVNSLGRLLNDLIEPINSRKQVLDALAKAQELVPVIRKITLDIGQTERSITGNEQKIISLKKEIEEKQEAQNLLYANESWKQYTRSKDELVLLENDAEIKKSEINSIISPLNKVINRLKQLSDSGRLVLKPEDRDALNLCLSCPVDVPPGFFIELQKIVEGGVLNLPKTDKILSHIQHASSSLGDKKTEYYAIIQDIELKKDEISKMKIIKDEKDVNDVLSTLRDKLIASEKELDSSKKQLDSLKSELVSKKHELQDHVSVIDGKMKIA